MADKAREMIDYEHSTPTSYAKALAYLSDPSTIHALVARQFGISRAPSLEQCRKFRAAYLRAKGVNRGRGQGRWGSSFKCDHPKTEANTILDAKGNDRCAQCEADRAEAKRQRDEAELQVLSTLVRRRREDAKARDALVAAQRAELASIAATMTMDRSKLHTHIISDIAARFGLTLADIRGGNRNRLYVDARAVVAMALRARGNSYPMISKYMGKSCHSTAINLCETFPQRLARNPDLAAILKAAISG